MNFQQVIDVCMMIMVIITDKLGIHCMHVIKQQITL